MAEEDAERSSKTEAPSQRRLDEARRKGDVARSPDVPAFMALAGAVGATLILAGPVSRDMAMSLLPFIARPDAFDLSGQGGVKVMYQALQAAAPAGAVMLAALVFGVLGGVLQQGFLWSPDKLAPDASKLNPMKGLARLFGVDGLVNFGKSLLKLLAIAVVAWAIVGPKAQLLAQLPRMEPAALLPLAMDWLRALALSVLAVLGPIAAFDWFWQHMRFIQRMSMTKQEAKEELKDTDGDPHVKAKRRQKRMQMSRSRMMQAVPKATVVVMNPTHYAVALRYNVGEDAAPVCVAKGLDSLALKIRAIAEEAKVPVIEDPPLARALHAAMEVEQTIPREHYEAVAKVIGFVFNTARGRRQQAGPAASRRGSTAPVASGPL